MQAGELLEKLLALLLETGVIGRGFLHIVVLVLQYTGKNQAEKPRPTFISCTLAQTLTCTSATFHVNWEED